MLDRIIGPPGCGKTTYLSRQVRRAWEAGHEVMVCSLTRTAAAEVAGRDLPIGRECVGTLHSHAYRSLAGSFTGIADLPKYIDEWNLDHPELALSYGEADLDEDNAAGMVWGEAPGDESYNLMNVFRAQMRDSSHWPLSVQHFANTWHTWKRENDLIDFTDMLDLALQYQEQAPSNPSVIFADESQDFSALEMALLMKWGEAAGRLVVVGDPWQALYQWRGADPEVFFTGDASFERTLSQSYRVPKAVHAAALDWIQAMPGYFSIDYSPTEEEGLYGHLSGSLKVLPPVLGLIEQSLAEDKSVMLLASCAYMLQGALKALRSEGIPFQNPYRVKNGAWNPLARRGAKTSSCDRLASFLRMGEEGFWTRDDLKNWLSIAKCKDIVGTGYDKFERGPLANIEEGELPYGLSEALVGETAIEASMGFDTVWYLENLQASRRAASAFPCEIVRKYGVLALKESPRLTIGTIHSVKGGEADVVILAPDLSQQGAISQQSSNVGRAAGSRLFYVGMTRAKEELHVLNPITNKLAVRLP